MSFATKKRVVIVILLCFSLLFLILDYKGIIWHNEPLAMLYEVKGLDVSHHQGRIDWKKVSQSGQFSFVYIKATEGHDFSDDDFVKNWNEAKSNGLLVGAYHFFSIRSSGEEQAKLFISTVPIDDKSLPPVIDIEIDTSQNPLKIRNEIKTLADKLEARYNKKPILYLTYDTYNAYVKEDFQDYNIWIRDVFKPPYLKNRNWLVWQYSNRGRVQGIKSFVDINVLKGSRQDLIQLTKPN